jgi:succinoglycan biosynthesis transport protein ExoP
MKELTGLTPSDCLNILWRRRWYAVVVFLLICGGVVVYAKMLPDLYISSSVILVEPPSMPREYVRPSDDSSLSQLVNTANQRIQSRGFIESLITDFSLSGYGTSETFSMEDAVAAVRKHIEVNQTSNNTFSVSYKATDPQLAQNITEHIGNMVIQFGSLDRKSSATKTVEFLEEEVKENRSALKNQEEKIKRFRSANRGQLPERSEQNAANLKQLKKDLEETENKLDDLKVQNQFLDRRAQERLMLDPLTEPLYQTDSTPSSAMNSESSLNPEAKLAAKEAELKALLIRYQPSYPDVVSLQAEVDALKKQLNQDPTDNSAASDNSASTRPEEADEDLSLDVDLADIKFQAEIIKNDIEKLEKKRESLTSQIQMYEDSAKLAPELETRLYELNRERERLEKLWQSSVSKRDEARRTLDLEEEDAGSYSIMDEASLPELPYSPNRMRIALMGLFAAFVMGIGASFGRELLDATLSTEEEVAATLKVPVLVSVYEISNREARRHARKKNIA